MSNIYDIILQYAIEDANAGNWNAVATKLNTETVVNRNPKSWTVSDLITYLGEDDAVTVCNTIKQAALSNPIFDGAWIALNTTGVQLGQDNRQAMIDGLAAAGNWSNTLRDKVKSAGVTRKTPAAAYGLPAVTASQCQASWGKFLFEQKWSELLNTVIFPAAETGDKNAIVAALNQVINQL